MNPKKPLKTFLIANVDKLNWQRNYYLHGVCYETDISGILNKWHVKIIGPWFVYIDGEDAFISLRLYLKVRRAYKRQAKRDNRARLVKCSEDLFNKKEFDD